MKTTPSSTTPDSIQPNSTLFHSVQPNSIPSNPINSVQFGSIRPSSIQFDQTQFNQIKCAGAADIPRRKKRTTEEADDGTVHCDVACQSDEFHITAACHSPLIYLSIHSSIHSFIIYLLIRYSVAFVFIPIPVCVYIPHQRTISGTLSQNKKPLTIQVE